MSGGLLPPHTGAVGLALTSSFLCTEAVRLHPEEAGAAAVQGPSHPPSPACLPADSACAAGREGGTQLGLQASSIFCPFPAPSGLKDAESGSKWGRGSHTLRSTVKTVGQFALNSSLCLRDSANFSLGTDSRRARCDELKKQLLQGSHWGLVSVFRHSGHMLEKPAGSLPASEWKRAQDQEN